MFFLIAFNFSNFLRNEQDFDHLRQLSGVAVVRLQNKTSDKCERKRLWKNIQFDHLRDSVQTAKKKSERKIKLLFSEEEKKNIFLLAAERIVTYKTRAVKISSPVKWVKWNIIVS